MLVLEASRDAVARAHRSNAARKALDTQQLVLACLTLIASWRHQNRTIMRAAFVQAT